MVRMVKLCGILNEVLSLNAQECRVRNSGMRNELPQ